VSERLKTAFLVAIWGDRYIEEFCKVALPSFLSPGNLPVLATETDFEVIMMTTSESLPKLESDPDIGRIRKLCPVKFLLIDDLITSGNYGVTLTLAYARGIQSFGSEQTNTTFVFMNSDFILADGSLRAMLRKLQEGARCIMAPSLRASTEAVLPDLIDKVGVSNGVLTMTPREMAKLTFANLHPTVVAKTVTQNLITCRTHNQIYWHVDENTLLARYYLIFMLAIRPEVELGPINSYCDYGFVPEMVPSGEFTILDDSDDFFMLELQATAQEGDLLRGGSSGPKEIARQLGSWTTAEHRRFGEVDIVFHCEDIPPELPQAKQDLATFVAGMKRFLPAKPLSHVDHYYWVLGLLAWATLKTDNRPWLVHYPPEIASPYSKEQVMGALSHTTPPVHSPARWRRFLRHPLLAIASRIRRRASRAPHVPIWNHLWTDYQLLHRWVKSLPRNGSDRTLAICDNGSPVAKYLSKFPSVDVVSGIDEILDAPANPMELAAPLAKYKTIFLHIYRANMRKTRRILQQVEPQLAQDGEIVIFIEHANSETDVSNFSMEFTSYLTEFLPRNWTRYKAKARFAGGPTKRELRLAEMRAFDYMRPPSFRRIPKIVAGMFMLMGVAVLTTVNNLRHRVPSSECPEYCSSFLLSLKWQKPSGGAKPLAG
jgi:hypothetical protein